MIKRLKIGKKWIGGGEPCIIIAEAGSNHDGKLEWAKQLIAIAVEAGADAVKFQTYSAERLYSRKTPTMEYLKKGKLIRKNESVWDLIKKMEIPREWHSVLADYSRGRGILFLSTPGHPRNSLLLLTPGLGQTEGAPSVHEQRGSERGTPYCVSPR